MVVVPFSSTWAEKQKLSSSFGLSAKACLVSGYQSHHYSDPNLLVLGLGVTQAPLHQSAWLRERWYASSGARPGPGASESTPGMRWLIKVPPPPGQTDASARRTGSGRQAGAFSLCETFVVF